MDTSRGESALELLELKLFQYYGIPIEGAFEGARRVERTADTGAIRTLRELRVELFELRKEAALIGAIPLHYPRHIVFIMKAISALLPWYTRPIAQFAQRTSRIIELLAHFSEELLNSGELPGKELSGSRKPGKAIESLHYPLGRNGE